VATPASTVPGDPCYLLGQAPGRLADRRVINNSAGEQAGAGVAAYFISLGRARSSSGKWPGRAGWRAGFAPGGFRACDPGSRLLFRRATAPAGACVTRARASPALGLRRGAREGLKAKSSPAAAPRLPGPLAPQPEMPPRVRASGDRAQRPDFRPPQPRTRSPRGQGRAQ
jgi:hypothetical protein